METKSALLSGFGPLASNFLHAVLHLESYNPALGSFYTPSTV